jgi:hypothetical protein
MNIVLIFICCMIIAFSCGFLAREAIDFGKMLIQNLRRIRVEIDMGNGGTTTPDRQIPPNPSDERLRIPSKVVDMTSDSEQPR